MSPIGVSSIGARGACTPPPGFSEKPPALNCPRQNSTLVDAEVL